MSERIRKTTHVSGLVGHDQKERILRMTGRSLEEWAEIYRRRRQVAAARGKLTRWMPPHEILSHSRRYGFDEADDYEYDLLPRHLAEQHGWHPNPGADVGRIKKVIMARLNPEKYPI